MKQVLLIAWREYRQYVFSRGFLLFLVLFPVGFLALSAALGFAESSKPVRYFTIYDETNTYTEAIVEEIEHRRIHTALAAWDIYIKAARDVEKGEIPAPFAPAEVEDRRIAAFEAAGGFEAAKDIVRPYLRDGVPDFIEPQSSFRLVELPSDAVSATSISQAQEMLKPYLLEEKLVRARDGSDRSLFAAIFIPAGFSADEDAPSAEYWSKNLTDNELSARVSNALNDALKEQRYTALGVPSETIEEVEAIDAPISAFRPDRDADDAELSFGDRIETILPAIMTYMLLVIIFGVGNLLLTNTIEERSNKIVEILLSSVTANQLMMGKLLGIGAVGLTMPTLFAAGGLAMSTTIDTGGNESIASVVLGALTSSNLGFVYLFYFLCAYIIFAMIFLAIGAVSNSLQDAQSYMGPVMLIVFAPLPFMLMVFESPNGLVASILTWIPIYTPYAVMMRAASDPPMWEILGATALMLFFAIFMMRIMGRIFRQAILQASPPKMRDVWRLTKKEAV